MPTPRLKVLVGTSIDSLKPVDDIVNSGTPVEVSSDAFSGKIVVHIKDYHGTDGKAKRSKYFDRSDRQGITWSIQVQGRFLKPKSANDVLFGNIFDRPLKLPWGSSAAFKFMQYIDPTLEHDLTSSTKPWALSPLISTMPHFTHAKKTPDTFDFTEEDLSQLGSSSASIHNAAERRAYFGTAEHRKQVTYTPEDALTMDFCYGFLDFSESLSLHIPGGLSFDLTQWWDGQPVRFVCCERGPDPEHPVGPILWCVSIELANNDELGVD